MGLADDLECPDRAERAYEPRSFARERSQRRLGSSKCEKTRRSRLRPPRSTREGCFTLQSRFHMPVLYPSALPLGHKSTYKDWYLRYPYGFPLTFREELGRQIPYSSILTRALNRRDRLLSSTAARSNRGVVRNVRAHRLLPKDDPFYSPSLASPRAMNWRLMGFLSRRSIIDKDWLLPISLTSQYAGTSSSVLCTYLFRRCQSAYAALYQNRLRLETFSHLEGKYRRGPRNLY